MIRKLDKDKIRRILTIFQKENPKRILKDIAGMDNQAIDDYVLVLEANSLIEPTRSRETYPHVPGRTVVADFIRYYTTTQKGRDYIETHQKLEEMLSYTD